MKRPLTTIEKVKVFWAWMKQSDVRLICSCGYCNSTEIKRVNPEQYDHQEHDGKKYKRYKTGYECLKCGALAWATETWSDNHLKESNHKET